MICPRKPCGGLIIQRDDELVCLSCSRIFGVLEGKNYLSKGEFAPASQLERLVTEHNNKEVAL